MSLPFKNTLHNDIDNEMFLKLYSVDVELPE